MSPSDHLPILGDAEKHSAHSRNIADTLYQVHGVGGAGQHAVGASNAQRRQNLVFRSSVAESRARRTLAFDSCGYSSSGFARCESS